MKKSVKIICLCLLLIICASFAFYHFNYADNSVKVDHTYFTLPDGYSVVETRDHFANITNNVTPLYIRSYDSTDIVGYIDKYLSDKENVTVENSEFDVNHVKVYKNTVGLNKTICHYWFMHDNKVHEIWTWDANSDTDAVVTDLIGSMRTFIF